MKVELDMAIPADATDGLHLCSVLELCRTALDRYGQSTEEHFQMHN